MSSATLIVLTTKTTFNVVEAKMAGCHKQSKVAQNKLLSVPKHIVIVGAEEEKILKSLVIWPSRAPKTRDSPSGWVGAGGSTRKKLSF